MKIKIIIFYFIAITIYQDTITSDLQNMLSIFDAEQGYESPSTAAAKYAQYQTSITNIKSDLASKNLNDLLNDVSQANISNPDQLLEQLFDGGILSLSNLQAAGFSSSEIQSIGTQAGLNSSESVLYANKGLSTDNNYDNIVDMYWNGIETSNITKVTNALKLLNNDDYANDSFITNFKAKLSDPFSSLNESLNASKFSPNEIQQICEAAGIDPTISKQIYDLNNFFDQSLTKLPLSIQSGNIDDISEIILSMATVKPNLTAELFQNGEPLDQTYLSSKFPAETDLTSILKAAGLQPTDIANYLNGNYTGPTDIPTDPVNNSINPKGPSNSDSLYDKMYKQALDGYKGQSLQDIQTLSDIYKIQAATIQAQMSTINSEDAEYQEYKDALETANARAKAAQDYVDENGDVPVDPV